MKINKINSRQVKLSELDLSEGSYRVVVDEKILSETGKSCEPYTGFFNRVPFLINNVVTSVNVNRSFNYKYSFYSNWIGFVKFEIWNNEASVKLYDLQVIECTWGENNTTINIPDDIMGGNYNLIISKHDNNSVNFTSAITVEEEEISIISPTSGIFDNNLQVNLSFNTNSSGSVNIELIDSITEYTLNTIALNSNIILGNNLKVLNISGITSGNYKIKVVKSDKPTIFDISNTIIIHSPIIEITNPNIRASNILVKGSNHGITWLSNDVDYVDLKLLKDNVVERDLEINLLNTNLYIWMIPNDVVESDDYKIRAWKNNNNAVFDDSDENILIVNTIEMPNPIINKVNENIEISLTYLDSNVDVFYEMTTDQSIPGSVLITSDIYNIPIIYNNRSRIKVKVFKFDTLESVEIYKVMFTIYSDDDDIYSDNEEFYSDYDNVF